MASDTYRFSIPSTILLLALAILPVAFLAPKGLAPLAALAGLLSLGQLFGRVRYVRFFTLGSTHIIFGIVALAGASTLWSLSPAASIETFRGIATVAMMGCALLAAAQLAPLPGPDQRTVWRRLGFLLLLSALLLTAYLIVDYISGGAPNRLWRALIPAIAPWHPNLAIRAIVALVLLFWTLLHFLDGQEAAGHRVWRWRAVLLAGTLILIALSPQLSARIALVVGLIAYAIGRWAPPRATLLLLLGMALFVLGLPFIIHFWLDPAGFGAQLNQPRYYSGMHRLYIWQFVAERVMEQPWLGWGLDSARVIPGGDRVLSGGGEVLPMHPHNGFLHYWLEFGLLGGGAVALSLAYIGYRLSRPTLTPAARAACFGYTAAVFTFAFLSFNNWHNWWIGLIMLSLAVLIMTVRMARPPA